MKAFIFIALLLFTAQISSAKTYSINKTIEVKLEGTGGYSAQFNSFNNGILDISVLPTTVSQFGSNGYALLSLGFQPDGTYDSTKKKDITQYDAGVSSVSLDEDFSNYALGSYTFYIHRISPTDGKVDGAHYYGPFTVTISETPDPPGSFSITSPSGGSSYTTDDLPTQLNWSNAFDADSYDVYLEREDTSPDRFMASTTSSYWNISGVTLTAGTWYWKIEAENDGGSTDISQTGYFNVTIPLTESNLVPSGITLSDNSLPVGSSLEISVDVENIGDTSTGGGSNTKFYLVPANDNAGDDNEIGSNSQAAIEAGGTDRNESITYSLPSSLDNGIYTIVAFVDADKLIDESSEADNLATTSFTVRSPSPSITYSLYRISDTSGTANSNNPGNVISEFTNSETVRITLSAANTGEITAAYAMLNIRNSSDHTNTLYRSPDSSNTALGNAVANTTDSPLTNGETDYYSFDIPASSLGLGSFDLSGKIKHSSSGSTWDTTETGAQEVNYSSDWWKIEQFTITSTPTPAVEYTIHRISDTSGTLHDDNPGVATSTFQSDETIRVTMKAVNTGTADTDAYALLAIRNPNDETVFLSNQGANLAKGDGYALTIDSPLAIGETDYYSFDIEASSLTVAGEDLVLGDFDIAGTFFNTNYGAPVDNTVTGTNTTNTGLLDWWKNKQFTLEQANAAPVINTVILIVTNGTLDIGIGLDEPEDSAMSVYYQIIDTTDGSTLVAKTQISSLSDVGDGYHSFIIPKDDLEQLSNSSYQIILYVSDGVNEASLGEDFDYIKGKEPLPAAQDVVIDATGYAIELSWGNGDIADYLADHVDSFRIAVVRNVSGIPVEDYQVPLAKDVTSYTLTNQIFPGDRYKIELRYIAKTDSDRFTDGSSIHWADTPEATTPTITSFTISNGANKGEIEAKVNVTDPNYTALNLSIHFPDDDGAFTKEVLFPLPSDHPLNTEITYIIPADICANYFDDQSSATLELWAFNDSGQLDGEHNIAKKESNVITYDALNIAPVVRHRGNTYENGAPSVMIKGVDVANRNFYHEVPLYSIPSARSTFYLSAIYNSHYYQQSDYDFPGGGVWKLNYHQWIHKYQEPGYTVYKALRRDGSIDTFIEQTSGVFVTRDSNNKAILQKENGAYLITDRSGFIYSFGQEELADSGDSLFLLTKVSDRQDDPNEVTLTWTGKQLTSITDVEGATHDLSYVDGYLDNITERIGNKFVRLSHDKVNKHADSLLNISSIRDWRDQTCSFAYHSGDDGLLKNYSDKKGSKVFEISYYSNSSWVKDITEYATQIDFATNSAVTNENTTEFEYDFSYQGKTYTRVRTPINARSMAFEVDYESGFVTSFHNSQSQSIVDTQRSINLGYEETSLSRLSIANLPYAGDRRFTTDWKGYKRSMTYNNGAIDEWTNRLQQVTKYSYQNNTDPSHDAAAIADRNIILPTEVAHTVGDTTVTREAYGFTSNGNLDTYKSPTHINGEKYTIKHDRYDDGRIHTTTDYRNNTSEVTTWNTSGRMFPQVVKDFEGHTTTTIHNEYGWGSQMKNARDQVFNLYHDEGGLVTLVTTTTDDVPYQWRYIYDANGYLEHYLPPMVAGNFDVNTREISWSDLSSAQRLWCSSTYRNEQGNIIQVSSPRDETTREETRIFYNAMDEVYDTRNAKGRVNRVERNDYGFTESVKRAINDVSASSASGLAGETYYEQDLNGLTIETQTQLESGRTIKHESGYDEAQRPLWTRRTSHGQTQGTLYYYEDSQRKETLFYLDSDPSNFVSGGSLDADGFRTPLSVSQPSTYARKIVKTFDESYRMTHMDWGGKTFEVNYRDHVETAVIGTTTYMNVSQMVIKPYKGTLSPYDPNTLGGQIILTFSPNGHHIGTQHQRYGDNGNWQTIATEHISVNELGLPEEVIRNDGSKIKNIYDGLNRLYQRAFYPVGSTTPVEAFEYLYDLNSRVVTIKHKPEGGSLETYNLEHNHAGQPTELTRLADGKALKLNYNVLGQLDWLIYPNNKQVDYSYDDQDRMESVTDWLDHGVEKYAYYDNSALKSYEYTNGNTTSLDYDESGLLKLHLTKLKQQPEGQSFIHTKITGRNILGQLQHGQMERKSPLGSSFVDLIAPLGTTTDTVPTYEAHSSGHKTLQSRDSRTYEFSEKIGNLSSVTRPDGQQTFLMNTLHQLISTSESSSGLSESYNYDAFHNLKTRTTNAGEDSEGDVGNFTAEADGEFPAGKYSSNASVTTTYFHNPFPGLSQLIEEVKKSDSGQTLETTYTIYGIHGLVHRLSNASGTYEPSFYHADETQNIIALSDSTGAITDRYRYSTFGIGEHIGQSTQPFTYVGNLGVLDTGATGLYHMRARWMMPQIDSFISPDPILGSLSNPISFNRYQYAGNDPYNLHDASGLAPDWNAIGYGILEGTQASLDLFGLIPGLGEPADIINGAIYVARGDEFNAALSFGAAIPIAGYGATGTKYTLKYGDDVVSATKQTIETLGGKTDDAIELLTAPKTRGNANNAPEYEQIVVDPKGNAIPLKEGEYVTGSPDARFLQVRDASGNPTGLRIDGPHKPPGHTDPRSLKPHAHVPGVTNKDGTPWLPVNE